MKLRGITKQGCMWHHPLCSGSSGHFMLCLAFCPEDKVRKLTFPHNHNFPPWHYPTSPVSPSARYENVSAAIFIRGKSYLIYSLSLHPSVEASVFITLCWIWISKPMGRCPDTLNTIFLGIFQGMWLLKCPRWRERVTEKMPALLLQGHSNLCLSTLHTIDETITEKRTFASQCELSLGSAIWMEFKKLLAFVMVQQSCDG